MEEMMIQGAVSKKRWILQAVLGFMLGRVWMFSINPFAPAYLCAAGVCPGSRMLVMVSVLGGVLTQARGLNFLQYTFLILLTDRRQGGKCPGGGMRQRNIKFYPRIHYWRSKQ